MNRIKELRRKYPMSQAQLAQALHVSQASISGYENGNYEPDFELTRQMADLFNVSIDYLLGRSDEAEVRIPSAPAEHHDYYTGVSTRTARGDGAWDRMLTDLDRRERRPSLSDDDLDAIADRVASRQASADAPKTPEARIVSFGMDNLPQETRERILGMIRAMFFKTPEEKYFKEEGNHDDT